MRYGGPPKGRWESAFATIVWLGVCAVWIGVPIWFVVKFVEAVLH